MGENTTYGDQMDDPNAAGGFCEYHTCDTLFRIPQADSKIINTAGIHITSTNTFGKHEVAADSFTRGGDCTPRAYAIVRPWTNGKLGAPRNIDHW
jgi:hypothetical protein